MLGINSSCSEGSLNQHKSNIASELLAKHQTESLEIDETLQCHKSGDNRKTDQSTSLLREKHNWIL